MSQWPILLKSSELVFGVAHLERGTVRLDNSSDINFLNKKTLTF